MIGVVLTGVGVLGVFGSITGNLPAMIAALFYPSLLETGANSGTPTKSGNITTSKNPVSDPNDLKPAIRNPFPFGQRDPLNWISDL